MRLRLSLVFLSLIFIAGCSLGMPVPTKKVVKESDVIGKWKYNLLGGGIAILDIKSDGTFTVLFQILTLTKTGTWGLNGSDLTLKPYWYANGSKLTTEESANWYITDQYTDKLAPFGGDSLDPDQWEVFRK